MRAAHPPKLYSGRRRRKSTCRPASHALRRRAYSEFSALPMQAAVPTAHNLIRTRSPERDRETRKKQDRVFHKGSVIVHSATKAHESNEKIPGPASNAGRRRLRQRHRRITARVATQIRFRPETGYLYGGTTLAAWDELSLRLGLHSKHTRRRWRSGRCNDPSMMSRPIPAFWCVAGRSAWSSWCNANQEANRRSTTASCSCRSGATRTSRKRPTCPVKCVHKSKIFS